MKITLIANDKTFIYNLRREVLAKLVEEGHQVTVLCQFRSHREALEQIGCRLYDIPIGRRNTKPFENSIRCFVAKNFGIYIFRTGMGGHSVHSGRSGRIAPCITGMHIDSAAGFCCELAEMAKQDALDNDK